MGAGDIAEISKVSMSQLIDLLFELLVGLLYLGLVVWLWNKYMRNGKK